MYSHVQLGNLAVERQKTTKTLDTTEMDFWRRAAEKSKIGKISNETIRKTMKMGHIIKSEIDGQKILIFSGLNS